MFLDKSRYPCTELLESQWQDIREEFVQLTTDQLMPWPERDLYRDGWTVFGLWALGERFDDNCKLCPRTASIVQSIPGLTTAGFSRLAPGAEILPHTGYTNTVLRCHLGLLVPQACGLRVGEEVRCWREGECLVFDDTTCHSAWNASEHPRIILLVDFVCPGATFDATVSSARRAIDQLRDRSVSIGEGT